MTFVKGSGESVENIMLPVTSVSMTGLRHIHGGTGLYRLGTLTTIRYQAEILGPTVRPLMVLWVLGPRCCHTCRKHVGAIQTAEYHSELLQ